MENQEACFYLFFRKPPFGGSYAIASGLEAVCDYLAKWRFDESDLNYLKRVEGPTGKPLFEKAFLDYLKEMRFSCDVEAVSEGEVVFPYEPILRITGPILQCQLLETPLLTLINFPTLIATKASRIVRAAKGDSVLEFGLRRAQGIDGGVTASRAAFVGGAQSTSNVLAGKLFDIPVRGTIAHSWVMAFPSEMDSFQAYAEAMPENTVFLVDTYDTIDGVKNAIAVGKWLKKRKKPFLGIRLDSGDMDLLSKEARKLLDAAGFPEAVIYASNELDEWQIEALKKKGAKIAVWGVGTHLVTGYGQPALDGVYKLSAIKNNGKWEYKIKLSEQLIKTTDPGLLQVRRYFDERGNQRDVIYDLFSIGKEIESVDLFDPTKREKILPGTRFRDLLLPIYKKGKLVYKKPSLREIQAYMIQRLSEFDPEHLLFSKPKPYPVGLEGNLATIKLKLMTAIKNESAHRRRLAK